MDELSCFDKLPEKNSRKFVHHYTRTPDTDQIFSNQKSNVPAT